MKTRKIIAVAALGLGAASAGQAADFDFYAGAALGGTAFYEDQAVISVTERQDVGYKLFGGVRFGPYLAVEGGWADLGKAKIAVGTPLGTVTGDSSVDGWFVDLVGNYPVYPGWSVLGRLGAFSGKVKTSITGLGSASESDTGVKFGLGLQYDISTTLHLRGEWERYRLEAFDTDGSVDFWSVGLIYRF